jgi:hypothetical protein
MTLSTVLDAMGVQADGALSGNLEEDDMYTFLSGEIAAQRTADLHRQAAEDRLAHHCGPVASEPPAAAGCGSG